MIGPLSSSLWIGPQSIFVIGPLTPPSTPTLFPPTVPSRPPLCKGGRGTRQGGRRQRERSHRPFTGGQSHCSFTEQVDPPLIHRRGGAITHWPSAWRCRSSRVTHRHGKGTMRGAVEQSLCEVLSDSVITCQVCRALSVSVGICQDLSGSIRPYRVMSGSVSLLYALLGCVVLCWALS